MSSNDKQYYIYLRSTKERVPCTKEEFDNYYRDINAFRQRQQYHGKCVCPQNKRLTCDMDCETCPFYRNATFSLVYTVCDDEGNERAKADEIADPSATVDTYLEDGMFRVEGAGTERGDGVAVYHALHSLIQTLTPEEQKICAAIMDNLSERSAATALEMSRNTYVYRRDKILERLKNSLKKFL